MTMVLDIVWLFLFFALLTAGRHATLIDIPLNRAAIKGSEVVMACSTDATIKPMWRTKLDQVAYDSTIFDGNQLVGQFARLYKLRGDGDREFALVMNATEETARRYICEEPGYQSVSAELIVLEPQPVCSLVDVIATNEQFQAKMECAVRHWGNWKPTMAWKQISTQKSGSSAQITESIRTVFENGISKSILTITSKSREESLVYNCTTRFSLDQKPTYTTAANVPDYSYTWTSPAITISPGVPSTSFVPLLAVAILLAVALIVTTTCLLIQKRKMTDSRIETAGDDPASQQVKVTECRRHIGDTKQSTYECIEAAPETIEPSEQYMELSAQQKTVALHEYVALTKNAKAATDIPISEILQLENVIGTNYSHENVTKTYDYIELRHETTKPSQNFLEIAHQTGSAKHEYLELVGDTASEKTYSQPTPYNIETARIIYLDYLIPVMDETNY